MGTRVSGICTGFGRLDTMTQNPANAVIHLGHASGGSRPDDTCRSRLPLCLDAQWHEKHWCTVLLLHTVASPAVSAKSPWGLVWRWGWLGGKGTEFGGNVGLVTGRRSDNYPTLNPAFEGVGGCLLYTLRAHET